MPRFNAFSWNLNNISLKDFFTHGGKTFWIEKQRPKEFIEI